MTKIPNDDGYHASLNGGKLANWMSELMGQLPCMSDDCIGGLNLINSDSYQASLNMMILMIKMLKEDSYHASQLRGIFVNFKFDEIS